MFRIDVNFEQDTIISTRSTVPKFRDTFSFTSSTSWICDTIVSLPPSTAGRTTAAIFSSLLVHRS